MILEIRHLEMSFRSVDSGSIPVLNIDHWDLAEGARVALVGPSGSGKTTLLHLVSGIRTPTAGTIRVEGREITAMAESLRDEWRCRTVGYIFQNYYLFPALSVLENTALPLAFAGCAAGERIARAREILEQLEMDHRRSFYPQQLSAGEKQRAVIARALVGRPRLVLADEPSAHLDSHRRRILMEMLQDLAERNQSTLLVATHDRDLADLFPERIDIERFK